MLVALADHSGKWAARSGVRQHDPERLVRLADAIVGYPKLDLTVRITTVIRVI